MVEHRALCLLHTLLSLFKLSPKFCVEVVDLAITVLRSRQSASHLMEFGFYRNLLMTERVSLSRRLVEQQLRALERVAHESAASLDAT